MDKMQQLFCLEDQKVMERLLTEVNDLIADSDAAKEKEMVRRFLQSVSQAMTVELLYILYGRAGKGSGNWCKRAT